MKQWKRVLSFLLTVTLIIAPAAFASAEETPASTTTPSPEPTATVVPTQAPTEPLEAVVKDKNNNAVTEMKTHLITTGSNNDFDKANHYSIYVPSSMTECVVKVNVTNKGRLFAPIFYSGDGDLEGSVKYYEDAACTQSVAVSNGVSDGILAKGTYYIKLTINDTNETKPDGYTFSMDAAVISSANQTLKNKTWICSAPVDYKTPLYYKVKVSKTAKIVLDFDSASARNVTLCNSKKKAISDEVYNTSSKVIFVVTKGTYYVKVTTSSNAIRVKGTMTPVSDKSGSTKAKAKTLKINGASAAGNVNTGDKTNKSDWYKFVNSKTQPVNVYLTTNLSSGSFRIEIYGSNGKSMGSETIYSGINKKSGYSLYSYGGSYGYSKTKLGKGTYYIKITKLTSKTSGTYTLSVKNK